MSFRFSLAAVLRVRESLEESEERALQKIQLAMARVVHQIEELTSQMKRLHEAREHAMQQSIAASHLHILVQQAQGVEEKKVALHQDLQKLQLQRDQQLDRYQTAHSNRKTLTDLCDKKKEVYEQDQLRAQQRALDDIFIARRHQN